MPKTKFKTADEIPTIERGGRGSKYEEIFTEIEKAKPKALLIGEYESSKKAANTAAYMRSVAPEGVEIAQRGVEIWGQRV